MLIDDAIATRREMLVTFELVGAVYAGSGLQGLQPFRVSQHLLKAIHAD